LSLSGTAGAAFRALGYPSVFPGMGAGTPNYLDIGAAQRKEDYPPVSAVTNGTVFANTGSTGTATAGGGSPMIGSPFIRGQR